MALGANLPHEGLAGAALLAAGVAATEEAGLRVLRRSSVWASPAWPQPSDQPDYTNAIVEIDATAIEPRALLEALMAIERRFGRDRRERWAARTMDLDIVDFAGLVLDEPGLTLPHPRAHERAFVLAPLAEAAPDWCHPVLRRTAAELLAGLGDASVRRLDNGR